MPTKWFKAEVIQTQDVTPKIRNFWLKVHDVERFCFKPGQFITLDLPIGEKRLDRWRSYSIANRPDDSNVIELSVVHVENGHGSDYLFSEVTPGSELTFKGPGGNFVLADVLDFDLVMICTGTGVAPFKSMIDHIYSTGKAHRRIHLIFGSRFEHDILYRQAFEALASENEEFSYSVALSREEFNGYRGYVHGIYQREYSEWRPDVRFYLCGWQNMIDEAVANLMDVGYQGSQIKYELYG